MSNGVTITDDATTVRTAASPAASNIDSAAINPVPSDNNVKLIEAYQPSNNNNGSNVMVDPTTQKHSLFESLIPIVFMIVAFYFLIMRPQQKREAKIRKLRNSVKRGDKVITSGGIIGKIHKIISDKEVSIEISENVRMRMLKASIAEVIGKVAESDENENTFDDNVMDNGNVDEHVQNIKKNINNNKVSAVAKKTQQIKKINKGNK